MVSNTAEKIILSWNSPSAFQGRVTGYEILASPPEKDRRSNKGSFSRMVKLLPHLCLMYFDIQYIYYLQLEMPNATIAIADLPEADTYEIKVRARLSDGFGPFSDSITWDKAKSKYLKNARIEDIRFHCIIKLSAYQLQRRRPYPEKADKRRWG